MVGLADVPANWEEVIITELSGGYWLSIKSGLDVSGRENDIDSQEANTPGK
ncbi:hypothetical protein OS31_31680 [Dickeya oryzae]